MHVGLMVCDCRSGHRTDRFIAETLDEIDAAISPVRWIALVPAACKTDPSIRRLIAERFFDFHTLPVDPPRLASALGHAHGMALLSQVVPGEPQPCEVATRRVLKCWNEHRMVGASPIMHRLCQDIQKDCSTGNSLGRG